MTRQEVAVARSHVEVWKAIMAGSEEHVLVLEDDIWFRRGAAAMIDRGWGAAIKRCNEVGPRLLYLSYADAGGTAERIDLGDGLFRPLRGLWFLSGYVLSRDPTRMLVNVYFNPGDDGATLAFGYRGSPCRIDLGFDATQDFHCYAIDWQPGYIAWSVDGRVVHERVGWDPTPLPHLPMHLYANLWVPRSEELAGKIDDETLPTMAIFRNISVKTASMTAAFDAVQTA